MIAKEPLAKKHGMFGMVCKSLRKLDRWGGKGEVTDLKIYLQQMKKTKNTVVPCMFANFNKSLQLFSSFLANYNEIRGGLSLLLSTVKSNTLKIILYNKH